MSVELSIEQLKNLTGRSVCPACWREAQDGVLLACHSLASSLQELIRANCSGAKQAAPSSVCKPCVQLFTRAQDQLEARDFIAAVDEQALPVPLRLDADLRFAGRGVTIAFLDSGFYPHADLTLPHNRILAYRSIYDDEGDTTSFHLPDPSSWHGMMTSVVAAGNGSLSNGLYRGLAAEAYVVLVKIGKSSAIPEANILFGLDWVLEHRQRYDIRIVNISVGGDYEQSYLHNPLAQKVEEAVRAGLIVVCAVGNAGNSPNHAVLPPASAPSAIAVGGLNDYNTLNKERRGMYRSSYGPTIDGLQKPEIIAPGIWVPAPILPYTPTANEAELLALLDAAPDEELSEIIAAHAGVDKEFDEAAQLPIYLLRQLIAVKRREGLVISRHYKYVDGTSFAAPIVSSLIACMLEANLHLTPQQVKRILIDTAERIPLIEIEKQGSGMILPRRAVEAALAARA